MLRRLLALAAILSSAFSAIAADLRTPRAAPSSAEIERRFADLRKSPPELYAFLYRMPKGGDLHNHLAGAVYAESLLRAAAQDHLCIDQSALALIKPSAPGSGCAPGQVDAAALQTNNTLESAMIDSLSMRDFVPGAQSAHDHFFATFGKFSAATSGEGAQFVGEVVQRAADQNESYLELMALSGGGPIATLGIRVGLDADFDSAHKKLEDAGIGQLVSLLHAGVDQMEETRVRVLGCRQDPASAACRVQVHYVFQVLRESPKAAVFAQVMAGFALAASDPRVVAVNFVQPEDGLISMRDYHLHMQMVGYAKRIYPNVHITLHAGELAQGLVPPDGLRFHIREAVEIGDAERIGHGVDIMYEKEPLGLLRELRERRIAVEINLTSNDMILGVRGNRHPFPVYRKYAVPLVLSTDDEGVARSQLTEEFERAVLSYALTYADIKQMVRNSIEYSFAPGASYWKNTDYAAITASCAAGKQGTPCHDFLQKNEKARLEADLEERFREFERSSFGRK